MPRDATPKRSSDAGYDALAAASDADLVFANNREATAAALAVGNAALPAVTVVVSQRESAWNPFYRHA